MSHVLQRNGCFYELDQGGVFLEASYLVQQMTSFLRERESCAFREGDVNPMKSGRFRPVHVSAFLLSGTLLRLAFIRR